ncbi:MAG: hypothetical protein ACJ8FY_09755 [Gemmataceae bacterium]
MSAYAVESVAYHEAGHAIAFMYLGIPLSGLHCGPDGGVTIPSRLGSPRARIIATMAGSKAARMAGLFDAGEASVEDAEIGLEALGDLRDCPDTHRRYRAETEAILSKTWFQVVFLAAQLADDRDMDREDIARLCRQPGSPLMVYSALYPRAKALSRPAKTLLRRSGWVSIQTKAFP